MPPEILRTDELAERLDVEPGDVLAWLRDGRIRPVGKVKGSYVFNLASVVEQVRRFHAARREQEAIAC